MELSANEIRDAIGAHLSGDGDVVARGVSTDSRTLEPGQLFFALQGENFDGHRFCRDAAEKGAAGLVVSQLESEKEYAEELCLFQVEDTLRALGDLAAYWRGRFQPSVVALSGSCGKTTTKDMVNHVAQRHFNLLATRGNFNNRIGVPLSLFGMNPSHTHALLELGMNQPGELALLTEMVNPEGVALTNVNAVHCGNFDSLEAVRDAKAELLIHAKNARWAVLNANCPNTPHLLNHAVREEVKVTAFGVGAEEVHQALSPPALPPDFWFEAVEPLQPFGYRFNLCNHGTKAQTELNLFGRSNIQNAVCAAAILSHWGLDVETVAAELKDFQPGNLRSEWLQAGDITIVADCYNSNPLAVEDSLRSLSDSTGNGRRIAVLGDMLELGEEADHFHRAAGKTASSLPIDIMITVGEKASLMGEEFSGEAYGFPSNSEVIDQLRKILRPGDVVLVKGSRGLAMEEIVEALQKT